jgi:hypothetical protein
LRRDRDPLWAIRLLVLASSLCLLACATVASSGASAAIGPYWDVKASWGDTNLPPGGEGEFQLQVRNVGDEGSEEALTVTDQLPEGVTANNIDWGTEPVPLEGEFGGSPVQIPVDLSRFCSGEETQTVTCALPRETTIEFFGFEIPVKPVASFKPYPQDGTPGHQGGYLPSIYIDVKVDPGASGSATNLARIEGGGAPQPFSDEDSVPFNPTPSSFGIRQGSFEADSFNAEYPFGEPVRQAGGHPFEQRLNFELDQESQVGADGTRYVSANGLIRSAEVTLPPGMIGNPQAVPQCEAVDFVSATFKGSQCPADTQVGYVSARVLLGSLAHGHGAPGIRLASTKLPYVPIYNLVPPKGTPVDLAFNVGGFVLAHIYATLDPTRGYAIKAVTPNISETFPVRETEVTIWGVPGDPAHDRFRFFPEEEGHEVATPLENTGAPWGSAPIRPFYSLPASCGSSSGGTAIRIDSYEHPDEFTPAQESGGDATFTGCDDERFRFEPEISLQPTDTHAGAPTGLAVNLAIPQRNDEVKDATELYPGSGSPKAISTPPLKKAVVTLPEGVTLSPSAAQGLDSCSSEQIGLGTNDPVRCPASSQFGTLSMHTPVLSPENQPHGSIYIAKQGDNPFHNFLSLYLVVEEPERGILVKLPGRVDLDPRTGQITTTFDDLPQFPVSEVQMSFKGGLRAGLVEPSTCGKKTIRAEFFSWQEPSTPRVVDSSYEVTQKPDGSPCVNSLAERPFGPRMQAGTLTNAGGTYSPFLMRLTRSDDDQELSRLDVTLPPGLAAKFAGVGTCSEAGIATAERRTAPGEGALELSDPSCPASSLIGRTEVGAGVGVPLTSVPGKIYLGGPYKGAPLSIVAISPAVVGPFDLGVVTVRSGLYVDPETAQGSARTDALPQILQGIPVRIRDVRLNLDRPRFTLNPTSCAEKQIAARVFGTGGDPSSAADDTMVSLFDRFQAADCASLGFKPRLAFRLEGGTRRGAHPALRATVTYPRGTYANIAAASVALPHSEFLAQNHIKTICTRQQFTAGSCPAGSVYGHAVARTPLFDFPLRGPVYLRSSSHHLPDLVAVLRGPASQPVEIDLDGRIDSIKGGIRTTFESVPDAPVSRFTLFMRGAKKGLLENSTNLCAGTFRATAAFRAQNGRRTTLHPALRTECGSGAHRGNR